jgi:hypothetical protein
MKTILLFFFACIFLMSSTTYSSKSTFENYIPFKVYIKQNGLRQSILKNEVTLNKKPFDIVFVFDKPNAVLVSTSFDKSTYVKSLLKEPLSKLPGYEGTGMAESPFNADKEVFIDDSSPSYWHYETSKENRFNKVVKSKDSIICTRTINQLYILGEKESSTLPIEQINKPVYFVFINYTIDPKTYNRTELQREMLKINWK